MKKSLLAFTIASFQIGTTVAQNVSIPDPNFKTYLLNNTSINTNSDTEIQVSEANAYTGQILCNGLGITDITGIEAFVNLTELVMPVNNIPVIDLSANTNLTYVRFAQYPITNLNLGINPNLVQLDLYNCGLTSIDFTNTPSITALVLAYNNITDLDLSMLNGLVYLTCNDNELTTLNIANGNNSNITYIDVRNNPNLGCIEVDNETYSTDNWLANPFLFDAEATFCSAPAGLSTQNVTENIKIYPNPAQDLVNILVDYPTELLLIDAKGRILSAQSVAQHSSMDLSGLESGFYFIRTAEGQTVKFIKQ
jgi:hypothetical protein